MEKKTLIKSYSRLRGNAIVFKMNINISRSIHVMDMKF